MRLRPLAGLGLLLLCSATWAQAPAPKPWQPGNTPSQPAAPAATQKPRFGKDGKPLHYYDGIPDTGQFLPDTTVLGRIDGRVFRVLEFRDRWFASYMLDRPKPDSAGRLEFLNSMVNREVLAALAREANRPFTFEDRSALRETRQRMLSNVVFARLVSDSAQVTREDVQHVYEQSRLRLHVRHIVADDPATAERARADVLGKRLTWAQAVKTYSNGRGDQGPDGDLGWLERTYFDPTPAMEVFDLADGQLSGVFPSADGWQFVQVLERRDGPQAAFDVLARGLALEVRQVKISRRVEQVRQQIRLRIGMAYDSTNITFASGLFAENDRQQQAAQAASKRQVIDLSGSLPEFQPADTARVLARWKDGRYTLGDFLGAYNAIPVPQREKIGTFSTFRSTLDRFVFEPYMAELAAERGLERDSLVVAELRRKEEQIRVEHLFADSVESRAWVTAQDRLQYFKEHEHEFNSWQSVQFAAVVRKTRAGADSLVSRLKAGEPAAAILRADSLGGFVSGSIRSMREDDRGEPYYKILFEEMRPGSIQVVGPDKSGDYLVLQKLAHEPSRPMKFEEVQGIVDESAQAIKSERVFKQFLARHRVKHDIELHPELLMRVLLTDPTVE
jgi:hypothetical protein